MNKKRQGFGKWHEQKLAKTRKRVLQYLNNIENLEIDDSSRGLRSINKGTRIELTTLSKTLKKLKMDEEILETKGKNKQRLFCIKSEHNANRIKSYEVDYAIKCKNQKPRKNLTDKKKKELKMILNSLENSLDEVMRSYNENKESYSDYNSEEVKLAEEIINSSRIAISIMKVLLDDRVALLPQMRSMILAASSQTSNRNLATKHFGKIRKKFIVDPRRIGDLANVRSYGEFIEFIQKDPWNWGFLDIPCPKCDKFAMKTKMHENGTWDLICRNLPAHKEELHFPASLLTEWFDNLKNNNNGIAIKYLQRVGIEI